MNSNFDKNFIMMGINLESQLISIKNLLKRKKKKTVILYPDNEYSKHVEKNIRFVNFKNAKLFKYSKDPKILTSQIEKLTNYKERKINLEARIKKLEKSEETKDLREFKLTKTKIYFGQK